MGNLLPFWAGYSKAFEKMSWQPERNINNICENTLVLA